MNIEAGFFPPHVVIHWGPVVTENFAIRKWSAGFGLHWDTWWKCSYAKTILGRGPCTSGVYLSVGPFFFEREPVSLREQSPGSENERKDQ